MDLGKLCWLVLGLVLGGMLGMAYGFGKASLRQQVTSGIPGLAASERRSTSARIRAGWWAAWLQGVSTEMVGAVVTALLLGAVVVVIQQQSIAAQKQELILQLGSPDNHFAVEAARILRAHGWGKRDDTTLQEANLLGANLQGASLWEVNLRGANLARANLEGAALSVADLQGAFLYEVNLGEAGLVAANLQGADLWGANLQGAVLYKADLQEALLGKTNLRGANLQEANLDGTHLEEAEFDEATTLPDGTSWTPDTDLTRFTDSNHPDFWRSDNPESPAFPADDD